MDGRNGLFTLGVYVTAAMLIAVVACVGIFHYGVQARMSALGPIPREPAPELAVTHLDLTPKSNAGGVDANSPDQQRIRLLEAMLEEKTQRLREQSELLKRTTSELRDLKNRYEEAVELAFERLALGNNDQNDAEKNHESLRNANADASLLEAQLTMAKVVHESLVGEVEALQKELTTTYEEMAQLKATKDQETTDRLRDGLILEAAAAGVLARVGKDAVPALRDALNHSSPVVRRWAATVLGGIGPDADEAVAALTETLSDADPSVRSAAQAALRAIER